MKYYIAFDICLLIGYFLTVNAQAVLRLDPRNIYSPGSTIALDCAVQGYPNPTVTWTKDSIPLMSNEKLQITGKK